MGLNSRQKTFQILKKRWSDAYFVSFIFYYYCTWKPFQIVFTPRKFRMNFCQNFAHSFRHFFSNFVLNVNLTFRVNVGNDPQKFVIRWESWFWPNFVQSWFCWGVIHILRNHLIALGDSKMKKFAYLQYHTTSYIAGQK